MNPREIGIVSKWVNGAAVDNIAFNSPYSQNNVFDQNQLYPRIDYRGGLQQGRRPEQRFEADPREQFRD